MKKLFALLLSLALALGCCAALAETPVKTELGTINMNGAFKLQCSLPEDYDIKIASKDNEGMIAVIGPTRMNYARVIRAVRMAQRALEED